jgi:hypothetical protein
MGLGVHRLGTLRNRRLTNRPDHTGDLPKPLADQYSDYADKVGTEEATVWRHLMPGSPLIGFTHRDPTRLLAHDLDFWIPPVTGGWKPRCAPGPKWTTTSSPNR